MRLKNISDWDMPSLLEIIDGERVEFKKQQFFLNKRSPAVVPDPRTKEFIELEALEFLDSQGYEVLAIRRITDKSIPFNGIFRDVFEAYMRKSSSIRRKSSNERSEECPIYDPFDDVWRESDDQLRKRIKRGQNNERG